MKNIKIDSGKLLKIGSMAVGVAGLLLSNLVESNAQKSMKEELKKELLKEMSGSK